MIRNTFPKKLSLINVHKRNFEMGEGRIEPSN